MAAEASKQMAELVARAWADEAFKKRLLAEPANVLREHGIEIAAGTEIRVVEPPESVMYFVLPPKPAGELTSSQLAGVVGGTGYLSGIAGESTDSKPIDWGGGGTTTTSSSSCVFSIMF